MSFNLMLDEGERERLHGQFNRMYERENPKPEGKTSQGVKVLLGALVVASVMISASHTIPAFLETIEDKSHWVIVGGLALAGLIMAETGMLGFAFLYTRWKGAASKGTVIAHMRLGLMVTGGLLLGANVHSVLKPHFGASEHWATFTFVVYVWLAVSAPLLAYIAGEVFAMLGMLDEHETSSALARWKAERAAAWDKALTAYARRSGSARPLSIDKAPAAQLLSETPRSDRQTDRQTSADQTDNSLSTREDRQTDNPGEMPFDRAVAWLKDPANAARVDSEQLSLRAIAELITVESGKVNKDTVGKAKEAIKRGEA